MKILAIVIILVIKKKNRDTPAIHVITSAGQSDALELGESLKEPTGDHSRKSTVPQPYRASCCGTV